jgi:hypothetical protein
MRTEYRTVSLQQGFQHLLNLQLNTCPRREGAQETDWLA